MKKWLVGSVIGLAVIVGGAAYALHVVKQEIGKQVVTILADPATQNEINKLTADLPQSTSQGVERVGNSSVGASPSGPQQTAKTSSGSKPNKVTPSIPHFTSRQQVVDYAESHFTKAEIAHYTKLYVDRANLTGVQKQQIKQEILSHFTAAEIQAMAEAVKKYP